MIDIPEEIDDLLRELKDHGFQTAQVSCDYSFGSYITNIHMTKVWWNKEGMPDRVFTVKFRFTPQDGVKMTCTEDSKVEERVYHELDSTKMLIHVMLSMLAFQGEKEVTKTS